MRAGLAVPMLVAMFLPAPARAQSDTDTSPVIPVHPDTPTILQLPHAIEDAWITDRNDFLVAIVGNELYVRPEPGVLAGVEALLELETRTIRRAFRLRVVERARDARVDVLVLMADAPEDTGGAAAEAPPVAPTESVPPVEPVAPALDDPAGPARASGPAPEPTVLAAEPERAVAAGPERDTTADSDRNPAAAGPSRFDLSVHAVAGLGATALDLAGYEPGTGWQPTLALGVRLAGEPRDSRWALEVDVGGERLGGPLTYGPPSGPPTLEMRGPWLRAMLGTRVSLEPSARWNPSVYVGVGAQAHLRGATDPDSSDRLNSSTMEAGGVLALGMRLEYRARDVLLGVEFRGWHGSPDEYRSISALLTVGRRLDQGE